jgi:hypothetical protein
MERKLASVENKMLSKREFAGKEFYAFCQQEYDTARNYLKNCGKPLSEVDRFLIDFNKTTVKIFAKLL